MAGDMVRVDYPGYYAERLPSGNTRHMVRVKGQKSKRFTLPFGPVHPDFQQVYLAARAGIKPNKADGQRPVPTSGTVGWMVTAYLAHLGQQVQNGEASPLTLKQRKGMGERLMDHTSSSGQSRGKPYRDLPMSIPTHELVSYRDSLMATPGTAKNTFKFIKAMYKWAVERGHCPANPAAGITVNYSNQGGAKPWTLEDLEKFRKTHPFGTKAHLALTLFMFTACRIGDAVLLGRQHEEKRNGQLWLSWQPSKKGSKPVDIPVLPPLEKAIRAQKVVGDAFLLTDAGTPFTSPEGLRNRMQKWCKAAKIKGKSSHGIRKAAGHLLALHGATQYEIMSIHGHANASTSQVYTADVERTQLAAQAAAKLSGLEW